MIFIIINLIALALALGFHKWMGVRAMTIVSVEARALPLEQVTDIGTKASESKVRRLRGRAKVYRENDGSVTPGTPRAAA